MTKCIHGVYDPSGTGISHYCTGCTVPSDTQGEDIGKLAEKWEAILTKENIGIQ